VPGTDLAAYLLASDLVPGTDLAARVPPGVISVRMAKLGMH
jgi:hypothetical protein